MSLRSRARNLQRAAGLTYQEALAKLHALGEAPAALAKRSGWPLGRCDVYCVAPDLDPEWREARRRSTRPVVERTCPCGWLFFAGDDERANQETRCLRCRAVRARLRAVVQPALMAPPATVRQALERVVERAFASLALWVGRGGSVVQAGEIDFARSAALLAARSRHPAHEWADAFVGILQRTGPSIVHVDAVGELGTLIVIVDRGGSLGLVRLAARQAEAEIRHLLSTVDPFVPPAASGGPSGAPASVAAGFAWPVWTPPRPSDPS